MRQLNLHFQETLHVSTNYHESQGLVEGECIGCKKDGLTVICKELFETSSNDKQATSDNEDIEIATTSHIIEKKSALEKMNEEEVVEYLKLIEELQKVGLGNSNNLIEVKQMLVKDRGLDENNLQYLTELDVQLDKQVNEITKSVEKSEKDREERQKELDDLKKMEAEDKLEESKMQVKQSELELKEKKKKKEETRNKMKEDKKLEESKKQLEVAERELEEKKKKKEETRKQREIDKQIAINEEKIKKIEEESKKLDEES
jgi:DNA repair exonuclease SbcCD ATPase subunit